MHTWLAGDVKGRIRHEAGRAFVPDQHELDAHSPKGLEERQGRTTGHPEHMGDAPCAEGLGQQFDKGKGGHGSGPPLEDAHVAEASSRPMRPPAFCCRPMRTSTTPGGRRPLPAVVEQVVDHAESRGAKWVAFETSPPGR